MPAFSGSFSGRITTQTSMSLTDQPNHDFGIAEVRGTQKSADPRWNNSSLIYWGATDVLNGQGSQRGYYCNTHPDGDTDFGAFEGKVTAKGNELSVEGTWKITGGTGKLSGVSGGGSFKTRMTSPTALECTWDGAYELGAAKAQAG